MRQQRMALPVGRPPADAGGAVTTALKHKARRAERRGRRDKIITIYSLGKAAAIAVPPGRPDREAAGLYGLCHGSGAVSGQWKPVQHPDVRTDPEPVMTVATPTDPAIGVPASPESSARHEPARDDASDD